MDAIVIRSAVADDERAVARIVREAYIVHVERIGREPAPMAADHAAHIAAGESWVATAADAGVIGVVVLLAGADALQLDSVAVAPAWQGRGIGRALIDFADERARSVGLGAVTLSTNVAMHENLRLYPALGYVETGRRREDGFDRVFFRKDLLAPLPPGHQGRS